MPTGRQTKQLALPFDRGSIRQRFALGIALMLLPMLLLGGASVFAYERSVEAGGRAAKEAVSEAVPLAELSSTLRDAEGPALATFYGDEPVRAYRERASAIDGAFASLLAERGLVEERADVTLAFRDWLEAKAAFEVILGSPLLRLPRGARIAPGPQTLAPFSVALRRATLATHRASHTSTEEVLASAADAKSLQNKIELLLVLTGLAAIFGAVLIARRLSRSVIDPVVRLQTASRKLGGGDFSERVEVHRNDEVGALAALFNTMAEDLQRNKAALETSQQHLLQAQKMEAVGQLAGGIAHDFNNLLLIVGSYAELLQGSFAPDDPRRADAAEIRHASERAAALTRQLLTFSRRDVTQPIPLDAAGTIAGLEPMLRRTLTATIDLRLELDQGLPATVIDPGELEQAVLNLVLNARNAMPDGGTLTIGASTVAVDEERPVEGLPSGAFLAITVSDSGEGMPDDVRDRALEPFFTTRAEDGGSGLGLATVYGIVTARGGAITIQSAPAAGTTVVLYLPTTTELVEAPVEDEPRLASAPVARSVVLLAEDEPTIRALTTRILSAHGYTVLAAASGAEALALSRDTQRIDVLLTDVAMPAMTGGELAARLAVERPGGLSTVFMSGYSDQAVAQNGVLDATTLYLQKPFRPHELLEILADALARSA